ncbi:MAG TPA: class I SAM-dependent methyltransferase, partial [Caulobacteraceae bacterium]
ILVLGAGGGLELAAFAGLQPGWRFTGVDPSAEMLAQAKVTLGSAGRADRVRFVQGYIPDAPEGPFDGASCLLTLHFVSDDGDKLEALRAIRARLKAGATFVLTDLCMDKAAADHEQRLDRYCRFALDSGAPPDDVAGTRERVLSVLNTVSAEREEELLREAGFTDIDLFYAGLSWRGWSASA